MSVNQMFLQAVLTFVAAALGAIFGAFLTRWTERFKQLQSLRATAYVDFLRGVAKLAIVQKDAIRDKESFLEERDASITVADAKARIAIYGGPNVVKALSTFIKGGAVLNSPERMDSFAKMCTLMRNDSANEQVAIEDVRRLLFS
ncbi:MAG TPA: hypothetical protein VFB76_14570 [Candidatus Angelobacter sp.]|nr:hypothetical protein [Candidatus Angelobacter sp.]